MRKRFTTRSGNVKRAKMKCHKKPIFFYFIFEHLPLQCAHSSSSQNVKLTEKTSSGNDILKLNFNAFHSGHWWVRMRRYIALLSRVLTRFVDSDEIWSVLIEFVEHVTSMKKIDHNNLLSRRTLKNITIQIATFKVYITVHENHDHELSSLRFSYE